MNLPLLAVTPRLILRLRRCRGRHRSLCYGGRPVLVSLAGLGHRGLISLGRRSRFTHSDPLGLLLLGGLGPRAGLLLCYLCRLGNVN
jgi:hypothetical protein